MHGLLPPFVSFSYGTVSDMLAAGSPTVIAAGSDQELIVLVVGKRPAFHILESAALGIRLFPPRRTGVFG
jgi:hypothetical protein